MEGGDQMRIEAYTQVQQLYSAKKATAAKNSTAARLTDQVQISSKGKDILTAKTALAATPDIREDVTAPIKAKLNAGTYEVTAFTLLLFRYITLTPSGNVPSILNECSSPS